MLPYIVLLSLVTRRVCAAYTDKAVTMHDTNREWFDKNIITIRVLMVGEVLSMLVVSLGAAYLLFSLLLKR